MLNLRTSFVSLLLLGFLSAPLVYVSATNHAPIIEDVVASGETRFEIKGLTNVEIIDGRIVATPATAGVTWEPFGYITVTATDASRIEVKAETQDRKRLIVKRFGSGWRVEHTGVIWCDIDIYRKIDINGKPFEFLSKRTELQFTIKGNEPTPDPDPKDNNPTPFTKEGLQVLIIYDTDKTLPIAQTEILFGEKSINWLNSNCRKDNNQPAFRVLDKDTKGQSNDPYVEALKLPRDSLPWLIVGNGKKGFTGPLPVDVDATIRLLEGFK